jgi:hypothetical protein
LEAFARNSYQNPLLLPEKFKNFNRLKVLFFVEIGAGFSGLSDFQDYSSCESYYPANRNLTLIALQSDDTKRPQRVANGGDKRLWRRVPLLHW